MAARAFWSGHLRLALVTIPVDIVPATRSASRISFHQIHEPSGKRIRYEKVVPGIGPVDTDEIVKGYEVNKGKYVLLTDEEIADVKLEAKKTVDLVQFVDAHAIDPIYFERPYYVLPSDEKEEVGLEAYTVLRDALKDTGKVGLGQIVVRGQSSIVAIKPCGKGLLMETLRFAAEVKKASTVFDSVPSKKADKDMIDLAEDLIRKKEGEFDPEKFKDSYTVALRELIHAKQHHRKPRAIEETPPASNVINLMDALKRSVKGGAANDDEPAARGRKPSARRAKKPRAKSKAKSTRKRARRSRADKKAA